jgi:hypothetical protein
LGVRKDTGASTINGFFRSVTEAEHSLPGASECFLNSRRRRLLLSNQLVRPGRSSLTIPLLLIVIILFVLLSQGGALSLRGVLTVLSVCTLTRRSLLLMAWTVLPMRPRLTLPWLSVLAIKGLASWALSLPGWWRLALLESTL